MNNTKQRWVICGVKRNGDIVIIGPGNNRTYPTSEKARKDADEIMTDYYACDVLPLQAIMST